MTSNSSMEGKIDHYELIQCLGKGGMGEVFLARDTQCDRLVALKRIREDLKEQPVILADFLKEAKIASQLCHPSIIPIYTIVQNETLPYYTMPYVEGETLRQILKVAREEEKAGKIRHPIGGSIPALMRVFWSVCQAIAYAHAKGIIHRDLKPENIIVGKYGETLLLDWGLADFLDHPSDSKRVPGTLSYMAPERAFSEPASRQSDIYSLGVILYFLLTLKLPFERTTLKSFRKISKHERLLDLTEVAPYRDIPLELSDISKRCLAPMKEDRYQTVEDLLDDLKSYMEGHPKWMPMATLKINHKEDWEFQENVVLTKHIALTRQTELVEWVSLMISKGSFPGNMKITTKIRFKPEGAGIGFLLAVPEKGVRKGLEESYCLWMGSHREPICKLFRSHVEVLRSEEGRVQQGVWHNLQIEKFDNHVRFYLDDQLHLNYLSHIPTSGTHIGILYRDADFELDQLTIYVGSQSALVKCTAIPDAFLANKDFERALAEYRRIGYSFPGRAEGREALFHAGVTLLEEAMSHPKKKKLFSRALQEFEKLHGTPGAPLEYLGKSLVYRAFKDPEEESKCLELGLRKYPKHPLLWTLSDQIVFRLHEAASYDRIAAYHFAHLAIRHIPEVFTIMDNQKLLDSLEAHRERLPFFSDHVDRKIELAFWLAKPMALVEMIQQDNALTLSDAYYALLFLHSLDCIELVMTKIVSPSFEVALLFAEGDHAPAMDRLLELDLPAQIYVLESAIANRQTKRICTLKLPESLKSYQIWAHLLESQYREAGELLDQYPLDDKINENSPLFFLFGCWLYAMEGEEIALRHFSNASDGAPRLSSLLGHFLMGKITLKSRLFYWETVQLYKQLALFYHCAEVPKMENRFQRKLQHLHAHLAQDAYSGSLKK